ncbi:hypothetical protein BH11MYX4_BH11MYX4_38730 [soil metagenome]
MHTLKHVASAAALLASALLALGSGSSKEKDSPVAETSALTSAAAPSAAPEKPAGTKGAPLGYCEAKGGYECEDYTIFTDGTAEGQKKDCHGTFVAGAACPSKATLLGVCTGKVMGLTRPKDGTSVEEGERRIHSYKEGGNKDTTLATLEELCRGRGGQWAASMPSKAAAPKAASPAKAAGKK